MHLYQYEQLWQVLWDNLQLVGIRKELEGGHQTKGKVFVSRELEEIRLAQGFRTANWNAKKAHPPLLEHLSPSGHLKEKDTKALEGWRRPLKARQRR